MTKRYRASKHGDMGAKKDKEEGVPMGVTHHYIRMGAIFCVAREAEKSIMAQIYW